LTDPVTGGSFDRAEVSRHSRDTGEPLEAVGAFLGRSGDMPPDTSESEPVS
jgi:hypothetical protein